MRFQHILEQVRHRPWLITEAGYASVDSLIEKKMESIKERVAGVDFQSKSNRGEDFWTGQPIQGLKIENGVAEIPIHGVIGQRLGWLEKACGAVDVADIEDELNQAEDDKSVRAILFNVDSPGGMVGGTAELADRMSNATKPTYVFSDGGVASAAYWLSASTGGLFGSRGSDWGSIGVYIPWRDTSGYYASAGIKVKVFSSGTYKGMGYPGTELTAEQEMYLQSVVNELAGEFYNHVRANRGAVKDEDMQGQMFSARRALDHGLIDGIVESKSALLKMI